MEPEDQQNIKSGRKVIIKSTSDHSASEDKLRHVNVQSILQQISSQHGNRLGQKSKESQVSVSCVKFLPF